MRKFYLQLLCAALCTFTVISCQQATHPESPATVQSENEEEEDEGYDGPAERDQLEFEKTKDPALGYVPYDRLWNALNYTESLKKGNANKVAALLWIERGPVYDSVGPSNGNTRAGNGYTAGRIRAVLVDTLNDPTGNTVFTGGVSGGLWKCTNFLSGTPNWVAVNDFFDNLAVSSIAQDPTNPSIMYFATGEATSNADAVFGKGVWKSVDKGATWTLLPATANYIRNFKIVCDAAGNVYLAARLTTTPASQTAGLLRSKDKGVSWTNITPTGLVNSNCTDIEVTSNGKLHAAFGYLASTVQHRYTTDPANVTPATWQASTGIRSSATATQAVRMEIAAVVDTLYAITVNTSYNVDSCYKSVDGGATWTKQNTNAFAAGLGSGQGWYNLTLAINPRNTAEIMMGGLDAYRSTNSGQTATRTTFWVTTAPYVHADHHFMQWWHAGGENRILIGCDGGLFLSKDGGATWIDRNRNLGIKQFYACAIHPAAGSDYLLAGAQDNGSHQLKNPGLSYSIEVTGGDGCFVHINQQNPQIQFTSYVYNQYRRSTNGGQTWSAVNLSGSAGLFVNPFDYDDAQNIMYASNGTNSIRRWNDANTTTTSTTFTITDLGGGAASAFKVSPYTPNRVFIGSSNGRLVRLDNANTVTAANIAANVTNIRGANFSGGNINCINTGTSDNTLVAVFTNYGINNVFYSSDGGTSWSAIDGNLPDMPVRWAVFEPGSDSKIILGTEAGIYQTDVINGSNTVWTPDPGFPSVRVTMLKVRASDNTVVASTHGRGLFTAQIPGTVAPEVRFVTASSAVTEGADVTTAGCRSYKDYTVNVGLINPAVGDATVTYTVQAGNTAAQGPDFDFTANGNFTTPSNQHVFASGTTGQKTITVRVYDDAEVEPLENFAITFTVSGSTTAVAGAARTHTVSITDNDEAPFGPANLTASFGVNNTSLTQPFRGQFSDSRTQIVYLAAELRAAGFRAGNITSLGFNVVAKNSTAPFQNFTIKLKNTTRTTANGGAFEAGAVTAYGPVNYSTVAGANDFNLTTPFYWDGVSNLLIDICYDNATGTATDNVAGTSGLALCHFERIDNATGCSLPTATFIFTGGARPDMTFKISTTGTIIASALNSAQTNYMHANNELYYYNTSGELIAKIRNLSTHVYGCTQVTIDRAGTGSSQFWNANPANYLMNKTFTVTPATNNATGRYELTLYYTQAEKAGWEAATGQSWNNIQLVKIPSAIKNVSLANLQPDGPGTIQVVTPVRGTFGNAHTLTYTFDNGFSGFGAGIPGRINTIITLSGKIENNTIPLTWTTNAEMGSTEFEIEKAYDKVNFRKIGTVAASGTKFTQSTYNLVDNDMTSEFNYYRVRMKHADGFVVMSDIILVRNNDVKQQMFVLTNPFRSAIRVRFARSPRAAVVFSLYDAAGKLIKRNTEGAGSMIYYSTSGQSALAAGVYVLDAYTEGVHYTVRLLKQ
jgi:trimeric autotransporter adhesin